MAKTRLPYAPEFRRQMVELVRAGRTPEELAAEFEPAAPSNRNWVAQSERNAGRGDDGLTTAEREELNRMRRENRLLESVVQPVGIIPVALSGHRLGPVASGEGGDPVGHSHELVPAVTTCVDDRLVAVPDAVAEIIAAHEFPDVFHRI